MKFQFSPDDIPSEERKAEWLEQIESLREYAWRDLDEWEREFIDSIKNFLSTNGFLTLKQREKLEELSAEHLG